MTPSNILVGAALLLVQLLAALPWLSVAFGEGRPFWEFFTDFFGRRTVAAQAGVGRAVTLVATLGLILAGLVVLPPAFLYFVEGREALEMCGRVYGAALQLQLTLDFFVLVFAVLLRVWPKGGAVTLSAFREGVRQPMYWLLTGAAFTLVTVLVFVPYFTFGEDHLMYKDLGTEAIMFAAVAFGALAASMFVSDEIEGRTALTLLSKPVTRREFLLGKYFGILLAALFMFGLLGCYFEGMLLYKNFLDRVDPVPQQEWISTGLTYVPAGPAADFVRGSFLWAQHTIETLPALFLAFNQVMVLVAIAVALATRVPMIVNLSTVLVVYFLAHLTPALLMIGRQAKVENPGPVAQLLGFVSQLFDVLLPDLESFRIEASLLADNPLAPGPFFAYLGSVMLYGVLYSVIVMLFGLILFEDRDLA
jgi:ABC-type transport system involved in multi-copper enzyme maturation permease subunit